MQNGDLIIQMSPSESYYTTTRKVSDVPKLLNEFPPREPYEQFLTIHCPPMGTFFFRLDFRLNEENRANSTSCEIVRQRYLRLGWKITRKVTLSNLFIIPYATTQFIMPSSIREIQYLSLKITSKIHGSRIKKWVDARV